MIRKLQTLDLFAGAGGLSLGFEKTGCFNIVAANEIDPDIATTYQANHPDTEVLNMSIANITRQTLANAYGDTKIDVIIGGPPCQSYSTIGKRQMDARANLFQEYKRILTIVQPTMFVFENVTGILSMDKGHLFPAIQQEFESIGYTLFHQVLDACDYGVPQHRQRVILVGIRNDKNPTGIQYQFPQPTHDENTWITLSQAIGDLPMIKSGWGSNAYNEPYTDYQKKMRGNCMVLTEHNSPQNNPKLIAVMEALKDGQTKDDLPEEIRPKSGYGNTYAKLWWDKPATTITRNFACPSSSRCIHPRDSRAMTIREGARLQSFPDCYAFYGSDTMKRLQIGNAVPPLLAEAIGYSIAGCMDKLDASAC